MVEPLERWLDQRTARLRATKPRVRAMADELVRAAAAGPLSPSERFALDTLERLVGDLEAFETNDVPRVTERLDWSRRVRALSIDDHRDEWQRAREAIRTSLQYAALPIDLTPQLGLVPLGANPRSGLWEFVHLRSSADPRDIPRHGSDGTIAVGRGTGIVFVLVPGGEFRMGSSTDPNDPNWVDDPIADESPPRTVRVEPFFFARHETTRGQWLRLAGDDPSYEFGEETHPAQNIGWTIAARVLDRHRLTLPSEAEWEYACRAGTTTPWSTGDTVASLQGFANIADLSARRHESTRGDYAAFDDGFPTTSPVGALGANAFGLHDMHGNVAEWCVDAFGRHGDRIWRGGSFGSPPSNARTARRLKDPPDFHAHYLGVRAARRILSE
jgi:hypothetical protein